MIALITGLIIELDVDKIIIVNQGIGYEIYISFRTYLSLKTSPPGNEITLLINHQITDRSQKLFGFLNKKEKEVFIALKSLSGLGEATALKVLSFLTPEEIYQAAVNNDNAVLEKIPKIKAKTSEKILFELNRNIKKFEVLVEESSLPEPNKNLRDISILALLQLGFEEKAATKNVDLVMQKKSPSDVGDIIKEVLLNI